MKRILILFSFCIAISINALAQSETNVYVAMGCNKDSHYHMSRYCKESKFCRHEHDKAAAKKCDDVCAHQGHMEVVSLNKAEGMGRIPCPKCCDNKGNAKGKTKDKNKNKKNKKKK